MHDYTMKHIGCYIKEHYDPENMTCQELKELYCLSKIFKNLLEGDKNYNIIKSMEEGENKEEMLSEEFIERFKRAYKEASPAEQKMLKEEIDAITD